MHAWHAYLLNVHLDLLCALVSKTIICYYFQIFTCSIHSIPMTVTMPRWSNNIARWINLSMLLPPIACRRFLLMHEPRSVSGLLHTLFSSAYHHQIQSLLLLYIYRYIDIAYMHYYTMFANSITDGILTFWRGRTNEWNSRLVIPTFLRVVALGIVQMLAIPFICVWLGGVKTKTQFTKRGMIIMWKCILHA